MHFSLGQIKSDILKWELQTLEALHNAAVQENPQQQNSDQIKILHL